MNRDDFLARVRSSVPVLPDAPTTDPGGLVPDHLEGDLIERFCVELGTANGVAHRPSDIDEARQTVLDLMQGHLTFMARGPLPIPGLAGRLIHDGYHISSSDVSKDPQERLRQQSSYEGLEVGITGADGLLAESGSVVLVPGRESPRMASLIPDIHIALARTDDVYPSLSHFLSQRPDLVTSGSTMVVVTGPSRTGDIEQTITLGVHGPRQLHVVLIPDG